MREGFRWGSGFRGQLHSMLMPTGFRPDSPRGSQDTPQVPLGDTGVQRCASGDEEVAASWADPRPLM